MKVHPSILSALFLIIGINCTSKKQQITKLQLPSPEQKILTSVGIAGEWHYNFPFYSSKLTLLENGIFHFFSRGCLGKSYSEGNWYYRGQYIICRSFDKYKEETKPLETIITSESASIPKAKGKKKSKQVDISIDLSQFNSTISYNFPDTSNTYLDNIRYRVGNGILQQLDQYGSFSDIKYKREGFRTVPTTLPPVLPEIWKINK